MSSFLVAIKEVAEVVISGIVFLLPFDTSNRLHWTGLLAFFILGFIVYRRNKDGSLFRFLFPSHMYLSQSSAVDVKVYLLNKLISPLEKTLSLGLQVTIITLIAGAIASESIGHNTSLTTLVIVTIIFGIVTDFVYYIVHRASHESPLLWPFHEVHHSAEHLTPLTAKRNHPVFNFLLMCVNVVLSGLVGGVIFGVFGVVEVFKIFGVSLTIAFFNLAGSALRHSHIWIDYGPSLDKIFISPAQHQIHHSSAPRHHNRNYGLQLAVWDWAFGTLYIPEGKEELVFGVADADGTLKPQKHVGLTEAMLVPFYEAAEILRQSKQDAEEISQ